MMKVYVQQNNSSDIKDFIMNANKLKITKVCYVYENKYKNLKSKIFSEFCT